MTIDLPDQPPGNANSALIGRVLAMLVDITGQDAYGGVREGIACTCATMSPRTVLAWHKPLSSVVQSTQSVRLFSPCETGSCRKPERNLKGQFGP